MWIDATTESGKNQCPIWKRPDCCLVEETISKTPNHQAETSSWYCPTQIQVWWGVDWATYRREAGLPRRKSRWVWDILVWLVRFLSKSIWSISLGTIWKTTNDAQQMVRGAIDCCMWLHLSRDWQRLFPITSTALIQGSWHCSIHCWDQE